jgi:hypothetical protein
MSFFFPKPNLVKIMHNNYKRKPNGLCFLHGVRRKILLLIESPMNSYITQEFCGTNPTNKNYTSVCVFDTSIDRSINHSNSLCSTGIRTEPSLLSCTTNHVVAQASKKGYLHPKSHPSHVDMDQKRAGQPLDQNTWKKQRHWLYSSNVRHYRSFLYQSIVIIIFLNVVQTIHVISV